MAQQHRHLDLGPVFIGEAREAVLAFAGAPGARDPNGDMGVLRQPHARTDSEQGGRESSRVRMVISCDAENPQIGVCQHNSGRRRRNDGGK